jgi:DNA repair exonuclease SbcCD ATPase subunit
MFPVLARDPVLSEESLPVLNSFKNFLDQERRRARKRILWVLLGFTVAFSAVLVVVAWMTSERARGLEADISQSKARAERNRMDSEAQIQRLGQMASMTATQNVSQMRKDITRNILWAHSVIASNVSSELSGRDSEMERLREKLSAIEVDNAMLARQLDELGRRLSALEDQGRGALESMSVEPEQPGRTNTPAPVMINSAKFGRSFQLRMPRD